MDSLVDPIGFQIQPMKDAAPEGSDVKNPGSDPENSKRNKIDQSCKLLTQTQHHQDII